MSSADNAAAIIANMRAQARPGRIVMLRADEAAALLEYVDELEHDRDGWRNVAEVRLERIAELEQCDHHLPGHGGAA